MSGRKNGKSILGSETAHPVASAPAQPSASVTVSGPPIPLLSLLWLALCTVLVTKQNELIAVFFSFVSSFAVASILSLGQGSMGFGSNRGQSSQAENSPTIEQRVANGTTKNLVGLLACVTSLLILCCIGDDDERIAFLGCSAVNDGVSSEFGALSIVTGYLAFDLWYSALCHPPPSQRIVGVWEDALTLTASLVVLAREQGDIGKFRAEIVLWNVYKCVRLVVALSRGQCTSDGVPESEGLTLLRDVAEKMTLKKEKASAVIDRANLWTVHGNDYDLRDFVDRHPGGREAIELGKGRDCTAMFESYHPFTDQHRVVLQKYMVSTPHLKEKLSSLDDEDNNVDDADASLDPFYEALKKRCAEALRQHGIDPHLDRCATYFRAAYYLFIFSCLIISAVYHTKGNIVGSFLFSVFGWLIGALGHDGGHFAVSRIPIINDISVWGISLLCNPVMWQHQHTYAHHSHTNEFDHDPDLHHFTVFLKVHRRFKHEKIYGLQNNPLFVFFAYTFVVFGTCIKIPFGMIKTGSLYGIVEWTDRKRPLRALAMLAHYALYIGVILVSPFFSGRPWHVVLLAVTIHVATTGLLFAIFSQINHLNERSIETEGSCDPVDKSWAASQVVTSNNFATDSFLWHVLSNGLNLQIEHHLFPGLNHSHLHVIAPTVRKTCEEFGVPYKSYETWSELMGATLKWLDTLSVNDEEEDRGVKKAGDAHVAQESKAVCSR